MDSNAPKVYRNVFDVFAKTWRSEGIRGLQRGLIPAVRPSTRNACVQRSLMDSECGIVWIPGELCRNPGEVINVWTLTWEGTW